MSEKWLLLPLHVLSPFYMHKQTRSPLADWAFVCLQVSERLAASDPVSVVGEKDLLKEMFPNEPSTPTGIR